MAKHVAINFEIIRKINSPLLLVRNSMLKAADVTQAFFTWFRARIKVEGERRAGGIQVSGDKFILK